RAYRVPELAELTNAAGLRITGLLPLADYDPARLLKSPALLESVRNMEQMERAAFGELLAGNIKKHIFYAVRADNPVVLPTPDDPAVIPVLLDMTPEDGASQIPPGGTVTRSRNGLQYSLSVPPLARAIVQRCDGQKSLSDIYDDILRVRSDLEWSNFKNQFDDFYDTMNAINRMVLQVPTP
ncbi:MAG: hypothetical protein ABJ215_06985, partial [Alphaproteobacteria bacterium]